MSNAIDDETAWLPKNQTVNRKDASDSNGDDDDTVFALGDADMGALNRYLHGGRVLPLDRDSYTSTVGIIDNSLMTTSIWGKVDELINVYKSIHSDCSGFLGYNDSDQERKKRSKKLDSDDSDFSKLCTWDKMNTLAQQIYEYSDNAGDTSAEDSYGMMLQLCGDYNKSNDQKQRDEYRQNIVAITEELLGDIGPIQTHITKVKSALEDFDKSGETQATKLETLETDMTAILNKDLGDVKSLQADIDSQTKDIASDQKESTRIGPSPIAGTIAGPIMFAKFQSTINDYEGRIDALNKLIKDENEKIQIHKTLQANVTSIKVNSILASCIKSSLTSVALHNQAINLSNLIGPALETIEKPERGWNVMGTMVQDLHDKVSKFEDQVPPLLLTQAKLDKIAKEWLKLNKYVTSYIQNAQLRPQVTVTTLDDYLEQLKKVNDSS
ncbi:hypothetical protein BO71DRAFT_414954 [Aspergillus ellipticus CBS 707.79]|uniref:Uncharacterized protein n=1 Tax=Aspergillus ellipticus CBS 707.79 TaxID=1448320 RepID=A0A319DUR6_9EURO|nr:hypothetical protein BO71DRAFT_414954 [Aspergillus ellipticus CBS 707.79]